MHSGQRLGRESTDGGASWRFLGLPESGAIGKIVVHPTDPNLVYVAALGHPFGKNAERGVFRSKDGGATWEHVLRLSDSTGAVSLAMNPANPREIYAGMWRAERKPWTLISGSAEGGVYRTTDGGDTWVKLGGGLPSGLTGKVGLAISAANPDRVFALIEAEPNGGLYRSEDRGAIWARVNGDAQVRGRPLPHRRGAGPERDRRGPEAQRSQDDAGDRRFGVSGIRRAGVHPQARPDDFAPAGGPDLRRLTLVTMGGVPSQRHRLSSIAEPGDQ